MKTFSIGSFVAPGALALALILPVAGTAGCGARDETLGTVQEPVFEQPAVHATSAWFGANCAQQNNHSGPLDITAAVNTQLNGLWRAQYLATGLTDPARGCDKNLIINYRCGDFSTGAFASFGYHAPEAMNQWSSLMDCTDQVLDPVWGHGTINVETAYYAANYVRGGVDVRFETPPVKGILNSGIRSGVKTVCDEADHCDYFIEYKLWGPDPAPGKDKDFHLTYKCSGLASVRHIDITNGEANHQSIHLDCLN